MRILRLFVCAMLATGVAAAALLSLTVSPSSVAVNVRWRAGLGDAGRSTLERQFGLARGRLIENSTWQYSLSDYSTANIQAIVQHQDVEDTFHINRTLFQPDEIPPSRAWRIVRAAGIVGIGGAIVFLVFIALKQRHREGRPVDNVFLAIMLAGVILRLHLATTAPYIHDEENTSIPLSQSISFAPGNLHLPIRGENHGALPAYLVKISGILFGTSPLGYRLMHVIAGMMAVAVIFVLTRQWYGLTAARWAAALMAFNEYYLGVSSRATAHVPHLLLVLLAVFAFSRFLATERTKYLYAAGLSVGLAFFCKEHSALLLPVFLLMLARSGYRRWLRTPHPYLACAVFVLVISPDLLWNLTTDTESARTTYNGNVGQASYASHLRRFGGIALSPYPSMFYARGRVSSLHLLMTGRELKDETPEYHSMNPALGVLLLGAVLVTTFRSGGSDALRRFLLLLFWFVFGFFSLIRPGNPPGRLDPVSWIWVEVTMIPAVILTGAWLADAAGKWRPPAWVFAAVVLVYAAWTVG